MSSGSASDAVVAAASSAASSANGLWHIITAHHCKGVCPHDSCVLGVLRGFRHGLWYGAKIRFPHALVMTFLFRSGSFQDKMRDIFSATWQHSRNLACYVSIYKFVCCVMRHVRGKETPLNSIIGGAVGGAIMFGTNTPVNAQINMYVMSRVILGAVRTLSVHGYLPASESVPQAYTLYAAATWAAVMYLFEWHQKHLQKSLVTSMEYLYHESNEFPQVATPVAAQDYFLNLADWAMA